MWTGIISFLFIAFYWPFVSRTIHIATAMKERHNLWDSLVHIATQRWNPDWSHMMAIPLLSLFFVARSRPLIAKAPARVDFRGLLILYLGLLGFIWGIEPIKNDMVQGLSMIVALFGLVLFLLGPSKMRHLWFPIVYLVFFIKVSDRIWNVVAWKLQNFAAACATGVLQVISKFMDFDVNNQGNTINIGFMQGAIYVTKPLTVAEACAGLRMLMAFVALGVAFAYLTDRVWWQRLIMVLMAVPIAVGVNVGRVVALGLLTTYNEEMIRGDFHTMVGMLMLIPAAGVFWLLGFILDRVVIEEPDGSRPPSKRSGQSIVPPTGPLGRPGHTMLYALRGLGLGVLLTALVGFTYLIVSMVISPDLGNLAQVTVFVLLGVALVLLVVGSWYVRRALRPRSTSQPDLGAASHMSWPSPQTTIALGVVAGVLTTTLTSFSAVLRLNQIVLIKEPIDLRRPLYGLPKVVGTWKRTSESTMSDEIVQELGTTQYINWQFTDKSRSSNQPGSSVWLHIAYYTGVGSTVPHVPDRCIVAGGGEGVDVPLIDIQLDGPQYRKTELGYAAPSQREPAGVTIPKLDFKATDFRYRFRSQEQVHSVVYFFISNGKILPTPDFVRLHAINPRDRFTYHCKIELGLYGISDPQVAAKQASKFLSVMLPEIMACLPDWHEVNRQPSRGRSQVAKD